MTYDKKVQLARYLKERLECIAVIFCMNCRITVIELMDKIGEREFECPIITPHNSVKYPNIVIYDTGKGITGANIGVYSPADAEYVCKKQERGMVV